MAPAERRRRQAPVEALIDELLGDILFRIPPDDPTSLSAAFVCKRWGRIVSDPGFRRRFREFHRTPPLLGFLCNRGPSTSFVSTSSFRVPRPANRVNTCAIDVRHGRVLLLSREWNPLDKRWRWEDAFHVWDPISGKQRELPVLLPGPVYPSCWNAAVLCAIDGCEHLDCHRGPFLVVFVGCGWGAGMSTPGMCAYVYSSEADSWSQQISAPHLAIRGILLEPSALAENALYFRCVSGFLKYDLAMRELSLINLQVPIPNMDLVMATEDGGLVLAYTCSHELCLLSRKAGPDDGAGWATKVINLRTLLPAGSLGSLTPTGFAHGLDIILVRTSVGIFTIDLKSIRVTKVCEDSWCDHSLPYISFCTPALPRDQEQAPQMPD